MGANAGARGGRARERLGDHSDSDVAGSSSAWSCRFTGNCVIGVSGSTLEGGFVVLATRGLRGIGMDCGLSATTRSTSSSACWWKKIHLSFSMPRV